MKKHRDDNFEITVREVAFVDRAGHQWEPDARGVLIHEVSEGSWAALGHLAVGDLVTEVERRPVEDVETFATIMAEINEEKPEYVVFKVLRGIHVRYVEIEPNWQELTGAAEDNL